MNRIESIVVMGLVERMFANILRQLMNIGAGMRKSNWNRVAGAVAAVGLGSASAHAETNLALTSEGASFVSASSFNAAATNKLAIMQNDLLTTSPVAWNPNGDTRYIFGRNDQDQWIEIDLGQIRLIDSIGALFPVPFGDRYVVGPFSVETSTDGLAWNPWGAPVAISSQTVKPVLILADVPQDVEFIKYFFGPTDPEYDNDGSSVRSLYAYGVAVPEPSAWALMLIGLGFAGAAMRVRRAYRPASCSV
jgi:hypothetical protein